MDALETLLRDSRAELCEFVTRIVGSPAAAEDIVQSLYLRVWEHAKQPDAPEITKAYLYTAARNLAFNHQRRAGVERRWAERVAIRVDPADPTDITARLEARELAEAVARAVGRLPERTRVIFTLSRANGMTYSQIANHLGISIKTVETLMGRALRLLRAELEAFYNDRSG